MRAITDALRVRTLQAAIGAYEQALDALPEHEGARRGLARLYRLELVRAEAERHEHDRLWFQQLVQRYDAGAADAAHDGRLTIDVRGACTLELHALADDQRRLIARPAGALDGRPHMMRMIPAGRYLIECAAGPHRARWPVVITAGGDSHVTVDADLLASLDDELALIPGGAVPLGEALELADARPPAVVDVPSFVARRLPITFAEYMAFIDDLRLRGDQDADAHVPRDDVGAPAWRLDGSTWQPASWLDDRDAGLRVAVCGITLASAQAYATWWSERTGRAWRLPTGAEWEKMARGADGRLYPWGDAFDAAFCKMRDSRPGPARPEPVGAFPLDASPYGVRDLAGGMAEWTLPDDGLPDSGPGDGGAYSRGGAWSDPRVDCRATVRRAYRAGERASRVGFRLVRSP
jgi:serine/threonine-protein kinase